MEAFCLKSPSMTAIMRFKRYKVQREREPSLDFFKKSSKSCWVYMYSNESHRVADYRVLLISGFLG